MPRYDGRPVHDDPLAFFLTWTTYGTWLPGDERGWVEKPGQFREPDPEREEHARQRLTEPQLYLDAEQRAVVEGTIRRHCEIRGWHLHVVKCLSNHVHVVVTAQADPEEVMDQLKAWCTRHLKRQVKEVKSAPVREKWWTQRGSKRRLYDEAALHGAIEYVHDQ